VHAKGVLVSVGAAAVVAVLVAVPANRSSAGVGTLPLRSALQTFSGPLLGFVFGAASTRLAPIDPSTLRPLPGWQSQMLPGVIAWAASPDRSRLAVSECGGAGSCEGLVRVLAMPSMRPLGQAHSLGREAIALTWAGRDRLLALAGNCCPGSAQVVAVDARSGTVTGRWPVPGTVVRFARTKTGFVLLVGPRNQIGTAHLVAADARGLRVVRLDRISAGFVPGSVRTAAISNDRFSALAVDRANDHAFVIDPDGTVATVALGSLAVSYHVPRTSTSLFARFDRWLQPAAQAKGDNGPWRQAQWLGNGLLAVSGSDWRASGQMRGNVISETLSDRPAGLEIIDTRTWHVHTLDPNADSFTVANGLLLVTGTRWNVTPKENVTSGEGLVAYDPHGNVRFRIFGGRSVSVNVVAGGRAYVTVVAAGGYEHQRVVDLRTGGVLATAGFDWPRLLVGAGDPSSG
jgi:hypothetical protein